MGWNRATNSRWQKHPWWPAYSAASRDTMLFNNVCRVVQDPDRAARLAMERVLKLA
jgi:carboxylesterase type B